MVGRKSADSGSAGLENELVAHLRGPGPESDATTVGAAVRRFLAEVAQDLAPEAGISSSAQPGFAGAATRPGAVVAAAERWAREGVALESVLGACHACAREGMEFLTGRMAGAAVHADAVADAARLLVRVVEIVTTAAASAYLDEHRVVAREHQTSAQAMLAALLSGHGVTALAKRSGIRIAPAYQVVALDIPPHAEERAGGPAAVSAGRRKLRRVQAALGTPLGSRSLSLLRTDGGTVLIPLESARSLGGDPVTAGMMSAQVLELIAEAAEVPPTAAVASGSTEQVPELAGRAHEALDSLRAAGRPPGLYRITESAGIERDGDPVDALPLRRLPRHPMTTVRRARSGKPGAA